MKYRATVEFDDALVARWAAATGDMAANATPTTWGDLDLTAFLEWIRENAICAVPVRVSAAYGDRSAADRAATAKHAERT